MKKLLTISLILAALVFASAYARAEDEQKGTFAGYDNGFYIKNASDTFHLNINGRVKLQYMFEHGTDALKDSPKGNNWVNTFRVRQARITFGGNAHEKLLYTIFIQYATGVDAAEPLYWQANFTYAFMPEFQIDFGQLSMVADYLSATGTQAFIEQPIVGTLKDGRQGYSATRPSFSMPDDIGLVFHGDISKFYYAIYVGNGSGDGVYNDNLGFSYSGRMSYAILGNQPGGDSDFANSEHPNWAIGAGGAYRDTTLTTPSPDPVNQPNAVASYDRVYNASANTVLQWKGLSISLEAYYQFLHVDHNNCDVSVYAECSENQLTDFGYLGTVSYFVMPQKLELAARGSQIFRQGPDNNAYQLGANINWYILKKMFEFQLSYDYIVDYDNIIGAGVDRQSFVRAQFVAMF